MARVRWPGWTRQDTLLLPVSPAQWPPPDTSVTVAGITLHPKRELHVTVVGRKLGRALRAAAATGRIPADAVRRAFEAHDWTWRATGERTLLRAPAKRRGGRPRYALVEHVDLPAMAAFHAELGARLGRTLPVPPPHVTLYVAGTRQGIGLPDPETLAACRMPLTRNTRGWTDAGGPA